MTLIFDVGYCIKKGCSSAKKMAVAAAAAVLTTDVHM